MIFGGSGIQGSSDPEESLLESDEESLLESDEESLLESDEEPLPESEPLIESNADVAPLDDDVLESCGFAASVIGRMPGTDEAVEVGAINATGVDEEAGVFAATVGGTCWIVGGVEVPMPPPPPATGLFAAPDEGRAGATFAEAMVITLSYRPISTVVGVADTGTDEAVVATIGPLAVFVSGATIRGLGEERSLLIDELMETGCLGCS